MLKRRILFTLEQVKDAAMSLATLVRDKNKPLVLDMTIYIENVIGLTSPVASAELRKVLEAPVFKAPDDEALGIQLEDYMKARHFARDVRLAFVKALHYELGRIEPRSVMPCVLIEVGHAINDRPPLKADDWVFIVQPIVISKVEDCFALDL